MKALVLLLLISGAAFAENIPLVPDPQSAVDVPVGARGAETGFYNASSYSVGSFELNQKADCQKAVFEAYLRLKDKVTVLATYCKHSEFESDTRTYQSYLGGIVYR